VSACEKDFFPAWARAVVQVAAERRNATANRRMVMNTM